MSNADVFRSLRGVLNGEDAKVLHEIMAPDMEVHIAPFPGFPAVLRTPGEFAELLAMEHRALPGLPVTPLNVISEGDRLAAYLKVPGRHDTMLLQQFPEEPPRGLRVAPGGHQDVQDVPVLDHRPPQVLPLPVDLKKRPRPDAACLRRTLRRRRPRAQTKLTTPLQPDSRNPSHRSWQQLLQRVEMVAGEDPVSDHRQVILA
ncbi:nuclear transport factor 2 family protein [Micromonospora sp. B11E3]|uniref:nuclear transport factor 2 family protein n=1 Tax=Micromonospora sp. B11E3 TaxID=3153562 RepID=UPI00325C6FFD